MLTDCTLMAIRKENGREGYVLSFTKLGLEINIGAKLHSKTMQKDQTGFWDTEFISHDITYNPPS